MIQYECYKHGLHLPWDAIARRFANEKGPPTAQCMIQHLSKLRGHMLDSGRWVPPLMGRQQQRQMASNDDVRGNVRYLRDGVAEVRDVDWDEDLSRELTKSIFGCPTLNTYRSDQPYGDPATSTYSYCWWS